MSAVVPSGCASGETEPSGFMTMEPESEPPTSDTLTTKLAAGLVDLAKIGRAAPERASIATSSAVWELACRNDAAPPEGCVSVRWNVRCWFVRFCSVTTNDRCSVEDRGLTFCGEPTISPSVIRLL